MAAPVGAQAPSGNSLPVTRCNAADNSCSGDPRGFDAPVLGAAAGRSTVLSPNGSPPLITIEGGDQVSAPIPGCTQTSPGALECETIHEYQHCRTLMISSMVDTCRIEVAFSSGYIEPRVAEPGTYELSVESSARVLINRKERGFGQMRGNASVTLKLDPPAEMAPPSPAWCLQRDRFLYYPTGPKGGLSEIEDTEPCDVPLTFNFKAHEDDLIRAWDLCDNFAAWDSELEDTIEILAAGIFHVRSTAPDFVERYPEGATIARFVNVTAPLTIDCRD